MASSLKIGLAQIGARIGDVAGNAQRVREAIAGLPGADLILFPELHISGYPPEDLVLNSAFQQSCRAHVEQLAIENTNGPALLVGTPWVEQGKLYNAVAFLHGGKIQALRFKHDLPNYGTFDEKRVFSSAPLQSALEYRGIKFGLPICEDIWEADAVVGKLYDEGAQFLLVPNGSPFSINKSVERCKVAARHVSKTKLPMIYLNRTGGQDEIVFDGASFVMQANGKICGQFPQFEEALGLVEWSNGAPHCQINVPLQDTMSSLYKACCMGLRDYVQGNGFKSVLLGLSGGIDSALVAAICADALEPQNVHAVMMPSQFTSKHSIEDAQTCAKLLGLRYDSIAIDNVTTAFESALAPQFEGLPKDVTEENLQSRVRGTLLMALSNKSGAMLITTGNKSEMAVGYATIYGDMNGGFNPIKDVYKTQVYELARWRNAQSQVIPTRILTKAPSAELRANQTDQDSLPPYDILDAILLRMVEQDMPIADIAADGFEMATIKKVEKLLALSEYKRRQSAPGIKLTHRNFGRDRRYPITNAFRDEGLPSEAATKHASSVCFAGKP